MKNTPKLSDDITPQWLTSVLSEAGLITNSTVLSVKKRQMAQGKAWLSSILRLEVEYDSNIDNAPSTFVLKMLSESYGHRDANYELGAYEREIKLYEHVAPYLSIRLPKLFYTINNKLMIMEDLSYLTPGDQILGMTHKQVQITLESLARVQATFWNSPVMDSFDWIPATNSLDVDYSENWDSFVELCGYFIEPSALKVGEELRDHITWLTNEISSRPRTLVHDDMKVDNLLFGPTGTNESVVILDWQFVIRSMGAIDVARLIGGSWHPNQRRGHYLDALKLWYDKLSEYGVESYCWDDAQRDLRLGLLYCLCFPVHFHKGITRAQGRALEYIKILYSGLFLFAKEIDARSILP